MTRIVVQPIRFTDNLSQMRRFLELLGLRPHIESQQGSWVDLVGAGGMVGLHAAETSLTGAAPGLTSLSFEADDLPALAEALDAAGVADVAVYDVAYGRELCCRDPLGDQISVNERMDDLYGYRSVYSGDKPPSPRVVAVRFADPTGPYRQFLAALGLTAITADNEYYVNFGAAGGEHGVVGLHHVNGPDLPLVPGPGAVQLNFESGEPLEDIAARLAADGHDAIITTEIFGAVLSVSDPDGQRVNVLRPTEPVP